MARRSLAHNFQAVWYGAAIMALCWPATPSAVKFAADSLLEGTGFELPVPRDSVGAEPISSQAAGMLRRHIRRHSAQFFTAIAWQRYDKADRLTPPPLTPYLRANFA